MATCAPAQEVRIESAGQWTSRDAVLTVLLSQPLAARARDLRVIAAGVDVTALARFPQPGRMQIDTRAVALDAGEAEVIVYVVEGAAWNELARAPLKLLTRGGFESAEFAPKLDLAAKSQFAEAGRGEPPPLPRTEFTDLTGRGSAGFVARRGDLALDSVFNATGASYRNETLRFGQLGAESPKVDLADYLVNVRHGGTAVSLGHLSYGNNPLLLNGFGSRGLTLAHRFGNGADVSFNAMNGTGIVGYDNFFGLQSSEHRVVSGGIGYEFFARPGALRGELLYMDARVQSRNNFNVGEVPDAEKSHGFGLRVQGTTKGNRMRGEAVLARSTYVNPFDPQLAQGGPSQPVEPATANGYQFEVAGDLLQNSDLLSATQPLTVTATLRHERVAPLFRSLGASLAADQRIDRVSLAASMAGAQVQFAGSRQYDNLDLVPTILRTRTQARSASLTLPLAHWLAPAGAANWWPTAGYNWQYTKQYAGNVPVTEDSGFAATHLPDQRNDAHQLSLAWSGDAWSLNYALAYSDQDNRQAGRERADFTALGHQVNASVRLAERLGLTIGLQRNRNYSRERDLVSYTRGATIGLDWNIAERWSALANYGRVLGDDSQSVASNASRIAQAQLAWRFDVPAFDRKLPGQFFVRYSEQASNSSNQVFGLSSRGEQRIWDAGLSMSLF